MQIHRKHLPLPKWTHLGAWIGYPQLEFVDFYVLEPHMDIKLQDRKSDEFRWCNLVETIHDSAPKNFPLQGFEPLVGVKLQMKDNNEIIDCDLDELLETCDCFVDVTDAMREEFRIAEKAYLERKNNE